LSGIESVRRDFSRILILLFMLFNLLVVLVAAAQVAQTASSLTGTVNQIRSFLETLPGYGTLYHIDLPDFTGLYWLSAYAVLLGLALLFMSYWIYKDGGNIRWLENIVISMSPSEKVKTEREKEATQKLCYCWNCGTQNRSDQEKCWKCGKNLLHE